MSNIECQTTFDHRFSKIIFLWKTSSKDGVFYWCFFGRCLRPGYRLHTVLASIPNADAHLSFRPQGEISALPTTNEISPCVEMTKPTNDKTKQSIIFAK